MTGNWRDRAGTVFDCEKQPASGSRGMVVSNHPLASAAGAEMLAAGGNAVDAAMATLFACGHSIRTRVTADLLRPFHDRG